MSVFKRVRALANKERVYALMLAFIILVNVAGIFMQESPESEQGFEKVFAVSSAEEGSQPADQSTQISQGELSLKETLAQGGQLPIFLSIIGLLAIFVLAVGFYFDIRILMARLTKREILKGRIRHLRPKWGVGDIFKLAIIFVFLGYILQILESVLFASLYGNAETMAVISLINAGIMDLFILGSIIYFVRVKYRQGLRVLGLKIKGAAKFASLAVAGYVAFLPLLILLLLVLMRIASLFNYQPPQQALFDLFLQETQTWVLVYLTLLVVVFGPIVEEIFFRGFAYNALKKKWGKLKAAVVVSLVFAGLHGTIFGFLPIAMLGLLLVYAYEKTGSLVSSFVIHMLHNGLMVFLLFVAKYAGNHYAY